MSELTYTEKLVNEMYKIESELDDLKNKKRLLKNELVQLLHISKKEGQISTTICNKKINVRARIRRTLNKELLLRDYNKFDSNLRSCFPLEPKIDKKKYNEMLIINPKLISQYVTESDPSYSVTLKSMEKKEDE